MFALPDFSKDINEFKGEMSGMRADISAMRADIAAMRALCEDASKVLALFEGVGDL